MSGIDKMKEELEKIQEFLEIDVSENPEELIERIKTLNVYMARSGRMLAEAKQKLREKKASEISKTILEIAKQNFLSAKAQNALVDSIAQEENFLVDWAERINKACTHQVDALRSLLSYEKEQLRLTQ
jgi:hypothetical protein